MGRWVVLAAGALLAMTLGLGGCVAVVAGGPGGGGSAPGAGGGTGGGPAVPAAWETLDQQAAATCAGLPWTVLAAVGRVESDSGQSTAPGVASGANAAGAEGPMQFEPATFAAYDTPVPPGGATPPSPYDPTDAVYAAARLLCADGGGGDALAGAVDDYDHSATYVATVLVLAAALAAAPTLAATPAAALTFAAQQLGVPYVWGGETPGIGFDCSGLVQAAYRTAGVSVPRVAQTQFDAGPAVTGTPVPGDLLFFGGSATSVRHVGIYLGGGEMIDAPYTGTVVRVDPVPTAPGAPWGGEVYVGATRPWAG